MTRPILSLYKQCGIGGPPNNVTGWGRVDILAAVPPKSAAVSAVLVAWTHFAENFDGVTPPALPPDWVATNAQGPPPLWVTSNSGVPMPPADSPPNAAFIDDPADSERQTARLAKLSFFEGLRPRS